MRRDPPRSARPSAVHEMLADETFRDLPFGGFQGEFLGHTPGAPAPPPPQPITFDVHDANLESRNLDGLHVTERWGLLEDRFEAWKHRPLEYRPSKIISVR